MLDDSTEDGQLSPRERRPTAERTAQSGASETTQSTWRRLRRGAEGGALATVVMTVYRLPVTRSLPPSAEFWARYVAGGDPKDHSVAALVLHLAYGVAAGVLFAALLPERESVIPAPGSRGPPSPAQEVSTTVSGLGYGLALSVFGERVVLGALLDVDPDDRFAFHVGHALYGITLGAWLGTRTRDE